MENWTPSRYAYRALDAQGRSLRGVLHAMGEADLDRRLRESGLALVWCRPARGAGRPVPARDLLHLCLHMAHMLRAGVPLLTTLEEVEEATPPRRLRDAVADVRRAVRDGALLSQALAQHPRLFGPVMAGVVAAGERTGHLADSFDHLAVHLRWQEDLSRRVRKALRYPLFMLVVMTGVIALMVGFVVPQVSTMLAPLGQSLPPVTRALMGLATGVRAGAPWLLLVAGVGGGLLVFLARRLPALAWRRDALLLRLPLVGRALHALALARFVHFLAVTYGAGIPLLEGLAIARGVVGNRAMDRALARAGAAVRGGTALSEALGESGLFPRLVRRMVRVGEETGDLDGALAHVTAFYDREARDRLDTLVAVIEPTLTMVVGLLMAWIVVAILLPVYEAVHSMGLG